MQKRRVAVLGGGISSEHEVSLRSAAAVARALSSRGHTVLEVSIGRDGSWRIASEKAGLASLAALPELARRVDVVFPALHGRGGEDGTLQSLIEAAGIPCAFSGPRASAIGMSKTLSRAAFVGAGVPMARALTPTRAETAAMTAGELTQRIEAAGLFYPLFLKEEDSGSSLGVERIANAGELERGLEVVRSLGKHWMIEEGVDGVEVTCAVLGNAGAALQALPPVEIRPKSAAFFDYGAKYDASATDELCPAPSLDARGRARVEELAKQVHDLLGCRGLTRSDMIWTGRDAVLLETNTIPGLTVESLVPKAATAHGWSFAELCERVLELALEAGARARAMRAPVEQNEGETEDSCEPNARETPKMARRDENKSVEIQP